MMTTSENSGRAVKAALLPCLLLLPAMLHAIAFALTAPGQPIGMLDIAVVVLLIAYLGGCVIACRGPSLWAWRFLLVGYATLGAAGLAEIAISVVLSTNSDRVPIPAGSRRRASPEGLPGVSGPVVYSVNNLGLRGPTTILADQDIRILCVGGSTTECLYVADRMSWPWRVQDDLAVRLSKKVFVGNAGVSGHFSLHHSFLLRHYDRTSEFQWVVVLCGMNDLGCLLRNNYEGRKALVPSETFSHESDHAVTDKAYYRKLRLVRLAKHWYAAHSASDAVVVQDPAARWISERRQLRQEWLNRNTINSIPRECDAALDRYRGDLKDVIAACRERGVGLVMITQPTLYAENLAPELEALVWEYFEGGAYSTAVLARLMEMYNDVMRAVCREEGIDLIDLAARLPRDTTVFYDDCHFNNSGCEKVASIVSEYFASKLSAKRK